jgi:hypothetical protein
VRESRRLLQHYVASIAYRTQKALRDAPAGFGGFRAGPNVRTPHELLRHMTSVIGYARTFLRGGVFRVRMMPTFDEEVVRFHDTLAALHADLASPDLGATVSDEQFLQGPLSDAMTHAGQLALLRRLAGAPVPPENFVYADVRTDRVGREQPLPASPDAGWAPDQPPES